MRTTSSSTSSSSRAPGRRFVGAFVVGAFGWASLLLALLIVIDPFATGRFLPARDAVPAATAPRMANAARIRNGGFDAAIIGNSTIQLLSPERLAALTGQRFVQLSIPGTGPVEQRVVTERLLMERGASLRTLVIGLDANWCSDNSGFRPLNPFPFWLYAESRIDYVKGLFRFDSVEALPRRLLGLASRSEAFRPDGFWNYELIREGYQRFSGEALKGADVTHPPTYRKAATRELNAIIDRLPAGVRMIALHPPVYLSAEGAAARPGFVALGHCKAELAAVLRRVAGSVVVDALIPDATTARRENFYDQNHYKGSVAVELERKIADVMLSGR
jgi:hypothetical protein